MFTKKLGGGWKNGRSEKTRAVYMKNRNIPKRQVAKAIHEESRKKLKKIEEMTVAKKDEICLWYGKNECNV